MKLGGYAWEKAGRIWYLALTDLLSGARVRRRGAGHHDRGGAALRRDGDAGRPRRLGRRGRGAGLGARRGAGNPRPAEEAGGLMRLALTRTGGFGGLRQAASVDEDSLTPDERDELRRLVRDADLWSLPPELPATCSRPRSLSLPDHRRGWWAAAERSGWRRRPSARLGRWCGGWSSGPGPGAAEARGFRGRELVRSAARRSLIGSHGSAPLHRLRPLLRGHGHPGPVRRGLGRGRRHAAPAPLHHRGRRAVGPARHPPRAAPGREGPGGAGRDGGRSGTPVRRSPTSRRWSTPRQAWWRCSCTCTR